MDSIAIYLKCYQVCCRNGLSIPCTHSHKPKWSTGKFYGTIKYRIKTIQQRGKEIKRKLKRQAEIKFTNWLPTKLPKVCNPCNVWLSLRSQWTRARTNISQESTLHSSCYIICRSFAFVQQIKILFELKKMRRDEKKNISEQINENEIPCSSFQYSAVRFDSNRNDVSCKNTLMDTTTIALSLGCCVLCCASARMVVHNACSCFTVALL